MIFWIVNIVLYAVYSFIFYKKRKDGLFLFFSFIHLGIIIAFRDVTVGTDTLNYTYGYSLICNGGNIQNHVIGSSSVFAHYMKLVSLILPYRNGYILATAIPTMVCVFVFIKEYSRNYFVSVYLYLTFYFYFFSMNVARQFLAVALALMSYHFVQKKRYICSMLFFLLAMGTHSAAIVFGIYYVIHFIKWKIKRFSLGAMVIFGGAGFLPQMLSIFFWIYPHYSWIESRIFDSRYSSMGRSSYVFLLYCIVCIVIELSSVLYQNNIILSFRGRGIADNNRISPQEVQRLYEWIILIFIAMCMLFFFPNSILFSRMANTLLIFLIVIIPDVLCKTGKYKKFMGICMLLPLFFFMFFQIMGDYSSVLNYRFYGY